MILKKYVSLFLAVLCVVATMGIGIVLFRNNNQSDGNVFVQQEQEIDWSSLNMNCLGDSVTQGGASFSSYVPVLKNLLNLNNCRNYGIGGTTIARSRENSFLDRYSSMSNYADIVCVFGGLNDYDYTSIGDISSTDDKTFYGASNSLIPALKQKYPNAYIFIVAPYVAYSLSLSQMSDETRIYPTGYSSLDYNVALRNIGTKFDIDVLDLWHTLDTDKDCFVDGIHPTEDFVNNILAPQIAQFIKDNYKK